MEKIKISPIPEDCTFSVEIKDGMKISKSDILITQIDGFDTSGYVAVVNNHYPEKAAFIVRAVNNHEKLVEALKAVQNKYGMLDLEGMLQDGTITEKQYNAPAFAVARLVNCALKDAEGE